MNRDDMDFKGLSRDLSKKQQNNSSPQFTRRHYIWLASAMRDVVYSFNQSNDDYSVELAVRMFADALSSENPNFNKQQFLDNVFCPNLIQTK